MRPISGGFNPYDRPTASRLRPAANAPAGAPGSALRVVRPEAVVPVAPATDVEIAIRMYADGTTISVKRQTVTDPDGTRRTVGIDALIK